MENYQVGSSAYLASSLFLLRRPLLPWTKPKSMGPPPVTFIGQPLYLYEGFIVHILALIWDQFNIHTITLAAHRGGAAEGYENTMEAFRKAVDMWVDALKFWFWDLVWIWTKVPKMVLKKDFYQSARKKPNFALKSWSVNPRVHPLNIWLNLSCIVQMWQLFYNNGPDLHNRGAEMLELDVHLSKDEHVVVAHDQVPKISPLFIASCSTSRTYSVWLARLWASGRGG